MTSLYMQDTESNVGHKNPHLYAMNQPNGKKNLNRNWAISCFCETDRRTYTFCLTQRHFLSLSNVLEQFLQVQKGIHSHF